ncbi:hypothetical protein BJ085DRAFT_16314 [Dimargaris cristalligena]|uniref:Major facilitator superfamily domain-containing protein n=1 Tax=Dimargaris cristalligena TaxID=215637 RepID=A0A4P9ZQH0_9FUNG|nr:hypothetical protein BJ085DRAFT_16314 [Dimargaris cristalligena]|eukprot:RKP35535.1 hypothetical protein BJ085DRAFT_16314 [Dimargaris cristalligena]
MGKFKHLVHGADFQISALALIILLTYGMYIAITTIGGGGQDNFAAASFSNLAVNATAGVFGFISGGILNYLGPRLAVFLSGLPFALYTGSLLAHTIIGNDAFVIVSGALLGIGNVVMWTAQGLFALSYSSEGSIGASLGFFLMMYSVSGVIGGAITLGLNFRMESSGLSVATYVAFIILAVIGVGLSFLLVPSASVRRADRSPAKNTPFPGWRVEILALARAFVNRRMLLAAPFTFITQWHAPYQFNGYNGSLFSIRSRGLNLLFYRLASILSSYVYARILDRPSWTIKRRGMVGTALLVACFVGSWAGGLYVQWHYPSSSPSPLMDLAESRYWATWIIFVVWGFIDIALNMMGLWLIACFTSDPSEVAMFTGAYTAWQALGATVAWVIDATGVDYRYQAIIDVVVFSVGFVFLGIVVSTLPNSVHYDEANAR